MTLSNSRQQCRPRDLVAVPWFAKYRRLTFGLAALLLWCAASGDLWAGPISFGSAATDELLETVLRVGPDSDTSAATRSSAEAALASFGDQKFGDCLEHRDAASAADRALPPAPRMLARLCFVTGQIPQGRFGCG